MAGQEALARRLGHRFARPDLLMQALTHRSAGGPHNERLEFLGDALLGLVIAEAIYTRRPRASEGQLTRMRASLVRRETLAELARELDLGEHLQLGGGELKSGGQRRDSVLANALEAVFGAIYIDAGYAAGRDLLLRLFGSRLEALPAEGPAKDPKTRLQEYLQGAGQALPHYRVIDASGADHRRSYTVECVVEGLDAPLLGQGPSRRKAEQQAAESALEKLEVTG
jgi:ribonuclease-3